MGGGGWPDSCSPECIEMREMGVGRQVMRCDPVLGDPMGWVWSSFQMRRRAQGGQAAGPGSHPVRARSGVQCWKPGVLGWLERLCQ